MSDGTTPTTDAPVSLTEELQPFETWAARKSASSLAAASELQRNLYWLVPCAKAYHGWPEGRQMTEAQFDAAIVTAGGLKLGNPS